MTSPCAPPRYGLGDFYNHRLRALTVLDIYVGNIHIDARPDFHLCAVNTALCFPVHVIRLQDVQNAMIRSLCVFNECVLVKLRVWGRKNFLSYCLTPWSEKRMSLELMAGSAIAISKGGKEQRVHAGLFAEYIRNFVRSLIKARDGANLDIDYLIGLLLRQVRRLCDG